jgi:hypothetical protein
MRASRGPRDQGVTMFFGLIAVALLVIAAAFVLASAAVAS